LNIVSFKKIKKVLELKRLKSYFTFKYFLLPNYLVYLNYIESLDKEKIVELIKYKNDLKVIKHFPGYFKIDISHEM
jgi:hypothetical protein